MKKVDNKIQRFLNKGDLIYTCKLSKAQQVYLPYAIMDYLKLAAGKDSVVFEVQIIGANKGHIRFAKADRQKA